MEHIWSPWRYKYITSVGEDTGCVFCRVTAAQNDEHTHIVYRDTLNFVILNLFPYTSGHLMVVPYRHESSLAELDEPTTTQMMNLAKKSLKVLESEYHAD